MSGQEGTACPLRLGLTKSGLTGAVLRRDRAALRVGAVPAKAGGPAAPRVRVLLAELGAACSAPRGTDPFPQRVVPRSEPGHAWGSPGRARPLPYQKP